MFEFKKLKTIGFLITCLVIGLMISGCSNDEKLNVEQKETNLENKNIQNNSDAHNVLSECDILKDQTEKDNCYSNGVIMYKLKDVSICDKLNDLFSKDVCYISVSLENKDSNICTKIIDLSNKDNCLSQVASAKKDLLICDKIKDQNSKDFCYSDVSAATNDLNGCNKIVETIGIAKEFCLSQIALDRKDISICDNYSQIGGDLSKCYSNIAIVNKDYKLCENITSGYYKAKCYVGVGTSLKNISICNLIDDIKDGFVHNQDINNCYSNIAIALNDKTICDNIITNEYEIYDLKLDCKSQVNSSMKNILDCKKNEWIGKENECYKFVARDLRDESICNMINSEDDKKNCYNVVLISYNP